METKAKNIKLFQILNDEIFWYKFTRVCTSNYLIKKLRENRTRYTVPKKDTLEKFIEDYRIIKKDTRDIKEIIVDLLSEI